MSLSSSLSSSRSRSRPRLGTSSGAAMARPVQATALRAIRRPAPPPLSARPGPAPRRPAGSGAAATTPSSPHSGSGNWEARARGRPGGGARLPRGSRLPGPEPKRRLHAQGREPSRHPAEAPPVPALCPTAWNPAPPDAPPHAPPHPRRPRPLHLRPPPPAHSPAPPEAPPAWVPARLLLGRAALGCPGTSLSPATRARGFPWRPEARSVGTSPNARWPALTGPAQLWKPLVLPAPLPRHTPSSTWSPGSRLGVKPAWSRSRGSPRSPGLHHEGLRSGHREASVPPPLRNTSLLRRQKNTQEVDCN